MSRQDELSCRHSAACFIAQLGEAMAFPPTTTWTAQRLFQQYSLFYPLSLFPYVDISIVCCFVASKIEDSHVRVKAILKEAFLMVHPEYANTNKERTDQEDRNKRDKTKVKTNSRNDQHLTEHTSPATTGLLDSQEHSDLLNEFRKTVLGYERILLESIGFNFVIQHGMPSMLALAKTFSMPEQLVTRAVELMQFWYHGSMCLEYEGNVLALITLVIACKDWMHGQSKMDQNANGQLKEFLLWAENECLTVPLVQEKVNGPSVLCNCEQRLRADLREYKDLLGIQV